jgi:predicted P-loop ATPase/phage/plasmid primase-like uncharacterized protein
MDFISEFESVLNAAGYVPVKPLMATSGGVWPRLRYMREKQPSGRYQLFIGDGIAYGTYGSDKDGGFKTWRSWDGHTLKPAEIKANKEWYEAKRKEQEKAEAKRHKRIATWLTRIYKRLPDAPDDHQYLKDKGVVSHHMVKYRPKTGDLVLPVLQLDGRVTSLQYISEKGGKWFFTGGQVKGGFVPITAKGEDWSTLYICEGFSTAMSVRLATGKPVICAFNAANLVPVAKTFGKKHPEAAIVIAADNDQFPSDKWPKGKKWLNTGMDRAVQAAGYVGGTVKSPEFDEDIHELRPTDWNDYACYYGMDKLKSALTVGLAVRQSPDADLPLSPKTQEPTVTTPIKPLSDAEAKWIEEATRIIWKGRAGSNLLYDEKHSIHNAVIHLSYEPSFAGTFVYDDFAHTNIIVKALPWDDKRTFKWREITDTDLTQLRSLLWAKYNLKIGSKAEMSDVLDVVSYNKTVHPVRDYFDTLEWDGTPRLDSWIIDYCNPVSGDRRYLSRVGACFLLAAVKRIYYPGTFHKQMLVLEGKQDIGKSTLLRTLATFDGVEYFSDKIGFKSIDNPYLCSHLAGRLIIEFAELRGLAVQDRNIIKAFISQTEDEMQPKHKMKLVKFPRQFVLAASTNDTSWMNDPTGGIRFWPVHCGAIDIDGVREVLKQLWAEAVHRVKAGEQHWIADDDPVYKVMVSEQSQRFEENVWIEPIREYVAHKTSVSTEEILKTALFIPVERWTPRAKASVSECLRSLGWDNPSQWCKERKKHMRKWVNPSHVEVEEEIVF